MIEVEKKTRKEETLIALKQKIQEEGLVRGKYVDFDADNKPVCFCAVGHLFHMKNMDLEMFDDVDVNGIDIGNIGELELYELEKETGLSMGEIKALQVANDEYAEPDLRLEEVFKTIDHILNRKKATV